MSPCDVDAAVVGSGPAAAMTPAEPSARGRSELAERTREERLHLGALAAPLRRRTIPAGKRELLAGGARVRPPDEVVATPAKVAQ